MKTKQPRARAAKMILSATRNSVVRAVSPAIVTKEVFDATQARREVAALRVLAGSVAPRLHAVSATAEGTLLHLERFPFCLVDVPPPTYGARVDALHATARLLADMHGAGLVHLDVKPDNVLLGGDQRVARLCDFATARETGGGTRATASAAGTWRYMAPEIRARRFYGPRSDVYSLGASASVLFSIGNDSDLSRDFVAQCTRANYDLRPSMRDVLDHPIFSQPSLPGLAVFVSRRKGCQGSGSAHAQNTNRSGMCQT